MVKYSAEGLKGTGLWALVILRVLIGWHLLYEGVVKVVNPDWTSAGFLLDSGGLFGGIFHSMASGPGVLKWIDIFNEWGLILIGLGLILGLFTRISAIAGMTLLALYFLSHPPLVGVSYAAPSEGSYLWVNKNLIEIAALAVTLLFNTGNIIGLDRFVSRINSIRKNG